MGLEKLKKVTGLPFCVLKDAISHFGNSEEEFQHFLNTSITAYADKKRSNLTRFPVFDAFYSGRQGVVVSLYSETNSEKTRSYLTAIANLLARSAIAGAPVEECIDDVLSGAICLLGENVSSRDFYHFENDDNEVTGIASAYLGKALALVTLEGCDGASARHLADLIAKNALYYFSDIKEYYKDRTVYDEEEFKNYFIKSLRYRKLIYPDDLRFRSYQVTHNTTRNFHVVDDLLCEFEKKHHLKNRITITDFKVFGI